MQPEAAGAEPRKLRVDHSVSSELVGNLVDEKITALVDASESDLLYEVAVDGTTVISYEATRQRMQADAASSAKSFSSAGAWILAGLLTLIGAAGVWANRKLRAAAEAQLAAA